MCLNILNYYNPAQASGGWYGWSGRKQGKSEDHINCNFHEKNWERMGLTVWAKWSLYFVLLYYLWLLILSFRIYKMKSTPDGSNGKESACSAGDLGSIPGLGRSLEKGKATHSGILAWRIPWYSPWHHKKSDTTERLSLSWLCWVFIAAWKLSLAAASGV